MFPAERGEGEKIQTKQGLVEPPSPRISMKDSEGSCRPLLVSIVYASACWREPAGKLPSSGDLQCRCLLEGEKKKHHEQVVVVLKGTQSLKKKKSFLSKDHKLGGVQIILLFI